MEKPEVVIAGVAGVFPKCENIDQLEHALFNKVHLVTDDTSEWELTYNDPENSNFPKYAGNAVGNSKFDATFFNVPYGHPIVMDPIMKKCLEASVEAIIDAGLNPKQLEGSRTGVYVSYENSETEMILFRTIREKVLMGNCRTMTANRLSFSLNLHGPSYAIQGGYGTVFDYFKIAKNDLEKGRIDGAIIACGNNIMSPRFQVILNGMGLAAPDGKCRSFDENAQGYSLSDSCVAFYLQRAADAKRNWATIVGADYKFLGGKRASNFVSFDKEPAKKMLRRSYARWQVDPNTVGYIEADGCGVKERDDKEIDVMAETFCKDRSEPLLIGSLKSNMGHAEAAACAAGTVKALIALNKSKIPPNLHLNSPNKKLKENKIQIVTDTMPLNGDLAAVNSIGLTGSFGHLLLRKNPNKNSTLNISEVFPQLLVMSSRTEHGIEQILERASRTNVTPEFAALLNGVFRKTIKGHMYRGFTIMNSDGTNSKPKSQKVDENKRPIWWVFPGMGSQWNGMGTQLLHIPVFRDAIDKCDEVLRPRGVDIKHIITTEDKSIFDNILHSFVGITAIQIGLVEILRVLELEPVKIVGHSVGELGCAYADNCMTLEQTILCAYARGRASLECDLIKGMMAAIGLGYHDIVSKLPETIDVACHNSATSCTISGPAEDVNRFVKELEAEGIFAKSVNVANIAYHSRYIQPAGPILLKYLREVIPLNTMRSEKWISSSIPPSKRFTDMAKYNSAEYHTNNLLSPVLFEDAIKHIPKDAAIIEIAPHSLLQAILKRAVPQTAVNVPLTKKSRPGEGNSVQFLLNALGQLYLIGFEPNISALYPPVQYPVPCDTPSLQPFVTWEHSEVYSLPDYMKVDRDGHSMCENKLSLEDLKGIIDNHNKNGREINTLTFFLVEVWKILGGLQKRNFHEIPVVFEDVQIHSEVNFSTEDPRVVIISVLPSTMEFEVIEEWREEGQQGTLNATLLKGKITVWENPDSKGKFEEFLIDNQSEQTSAEDEIEKCFSSSVDISVFLKTQSVNELQLFNKGIMGKITWGHEWVHNLDTIIKLSSLRDVHENVHPEIPSSIQFLRIDPNQVYTMEEGSKVPFMFDTKLRYFECAGITVENLKTYPATKRKTVMNTAVTEHHHFVPYGKTSFTSYHEFLLACLQIMAENSSKIDSKLDEPFRINVRHLQNGRIDPLIGVLEDVLRLYDNELNVALVPSALSSGEDSAFDSSLSILTDSQTILHFTSTKNTQNVYLLLVLPDDIPIESINGYASVNGQEFAVVYEQVFGQNSFGFLKKVDQSQKLRVGKVSENLQSSIAALKVSQNPKEETIVLPIRRQHLTKPFFTTQEILREINSHNIKCFFILDEDVPAFSIGKKLYSEQLKKGMKVNVLMDGQWGSYRRQLIPNITESNWSRVLLLDGQASKKVNVSFVGLVSADPLNNEEHAGPAVLDYSGVTCSGDHVIGIAYSDNQVYGNIMPDPIFQWKIPSYVSLEDAATLPYAYLMANLIIADFVKHEGKKTILIHNGHTQVGLACIAVAIDAGHTVYTTVPNKVAAATISRIFPQIPSSNIIDHNNTNFFLPLMLETQGRGADIIVSDLPRDKMLISWTCLARYGCFYNLNTSVAEHNAPLPMSPFLKCTSYFSYSIGDVLRMPTYRKTQLHGLMERFLQSEQAVVLPRQILAADEVRFRPSLVEMTQKRGEKIVLSFGNAHSGDKNRIGPEIKNKLSPCDPQKTYVILSSTIGKSASLIEWLLDNKAKMIVLATMPPMSSSHAVKRINSRVAKNKATIVMTSASNAQTVTGAEGLLEQASRMGEVSAVFTVSLDQNGDILTNMKEAVKKLGRRCSCINIQDEKCTKIPEDVVSIVCNDSLDYTHILSHAMLNSSKPSMYVVKKKTKNGQQAKPENSGKSEQAAKITDFLPSSLEELAQIGENLLERDALCVADGCAKFIPSASLAPRKTEKKDVRPVFFIPAFSEAQLRPLISRLMYPCFVAHIRHSTSPINQIALDLLDSMMQIQKQGPFTLVAETWSGGVGKALSQRLSDAGHGVSLFLLNGVPQRLCSLLLPQDSLNGYLIKTMQISEKISKNALKSFDETQDLETVLNLKTGEREKAQVIRALKAIKGSLENLRSVSDSKICLKDSLVLFEVDHLCQLTSTELGSMSVKKVQLIKSESKTYKEMLCDPIVSTTISREAPFSWAVY